MEEGRREMNGAIVGNGVNEMELDRPFISYKIHDQIPACFSSHTASQ